MTDRTTEPASAVAAAHLRWLWGWDRAPDDPPFDFRAIQGEFYDWTVEDALLYDDADPEHRVARSAEEYQAIWEPVFDRLTIAEHRLADGPYVLASGDLATSRLVFVARLVTVDGTETGLRATNSLTWRRSAGNWRIMWDHTSSTTLDPATLADLMVALPGRPD